MEEIILKIEGYRKAGSLKHADYLKLLVEVEKLKKISTLNKQLGDISDALYQINENLNR